MKKKQDDSLDINKINRMEIISRTINGKQLFFVIDCDKSFCNECEKEACTLEYFFQKNPEKAKTFANELYNHAVSKFPNIKTMFKNKKDIITYLLKKCAGYDNYYDFLFKGNKLISVKYDDYINLRKKEIK